MPELNSFSFASALTGLGSLLSSPDQAVEIIKSNFPATEVMQDEKGNFILRSSMDGKDYAIPPGFAMGDLPRAIGGVAAFTPAGRATTILGAGVVLLELKQALRLQKLVLVRKFGLMKLQKRLLLQVL
jgi:hypothetical protein